MIFWSLIALVVLAPLPFASVPAWSWGLIACITGILLIAWAARLVIDGETPPVGLHRIWPFALLFGFTLAWAAVQVLPVAPASWHHPLWRSVADTLGHAGDSSISLNPFATRTALVRLLAYGGVFWLSLQYCRSSERAWQAIYAIAIAGLVYSAYGLIVEFSGTKMILWYDKNAYRGDLTSTFVNRNSYATYAGLTLICASGLLLKILSENFGAYAGWREGFRRLLDHVAARASILVVAWIAISMAVLLTHSRGGFISAFLGMLVLCLTLALTRQVKLRFAVFVTGLVIVAGAFFFALGGDVTDQRLARTLVQTEERPRVYELTVQAIEAAPLLGTGYGTFEEVFRFYRDPSLKNFYERAHNTYLENTLELGMPGAAALFLTIGGLSLLTLLGVLRRRRDAIFPCIGFAATTLVASHSLVDFSLQIPAVALTYSLLMGVACAQSFSTRKRADSGGG